MLKAQASALRSDCGVSITELSVVSLIVGLVMAVVMGLFSGFFGNIQVIYDLEDVERQSRPVIRELVIQARQSIARGDAGDLHPVAELAWDTLSFYSDRLPYDDGGAPELHTYELIDCSNGDEGGVCDLQLTVVPPDDPAAEVWTYTGAPSIVRVELENVLADDPSVVAGGALFEGIEWAGDPASQVVVASCEESTGSDCDFQLVEIHLRVDPNPAKENPRIFEIEESVRLRNA